jgi:hypothetical protein
MSHYRGQQVKHGWQNAQRSTKDNGVVYTDRRVGNCAERHCDYDDSVTVYAPGIPGVTSTPVAVAQINRSGADRDLQGYTLSAGEAASLLCFTKDMLHYLVTPVDMGLGNRGGFLRAIEAGRPRAILSRNYAEELFEIPLAAVSGVENAYEFTHRFTGGNPGADCPDLECLESTYRILATTKVNASFPRIVGFRTGKRVQRGSPLAPDTRYVARGDVVYAAGSEDAVGGLIGRRFCPLDEQGRLRGPKSTFRVEPAIDNRPLLKKVFGPKGLKCEMREEYELIADGLQRRGWRTDSDEARGLPIGDFVLDPSHLVDPARGVVLDAEGQIVASFRHSVSDGTHHLEDFTPGGAVARTPAVGAELADRLVNARAVCLWYSGEADREFERKATAALALQVGHAEPVKTLCFPGMTGITPMVGEPVHGTIPLVAQGADPQGLPTTARGIVSRWAQSYEIPGDAVRAAFSFGEVLGRPAFTVVLTGELPA